MFMFSRKRDEMSNGILDVLFLLGSLVTMTLARLQAKTAQSRVLRALAIRPEVLPTIDLELTATFQIPNILTLHQC